MHASTAEYLDRRCLGSQFGVYERSVLVAHQHGLDGDIYIVIVYVYPLFLESGQ